MNCRQNSIMKKIITLVFYMLSLANLTGQQPVDYIFKARGLAASGKTNLALDQLTKAIDEKGESSVYLERAEIYLLEGNYSAAISDCNEANAKRLNSGEYSLARIYSAKGDPATALYHLEMNLKSEFRKSEKVIMSETSFRKIENSQEWRKFWRNEWYSVGEKAISEIEFYISSGKINRSKEVLSELKKNSVASEDILYSESLVNLATGKNSEVIKAVSGLASSGPGREKYLRVLARAQDNSGNAAGASATYTEMLKMGIADPELLIRRAECLRKTGETDKAMADVEKYLGIYPEDKNAISMAGKVAAQSGDNIKAMEYYSENLRLHPNDPQCYIDRANSYFVSKSWEWAIKDYSMSLDLQPVNSDVWLNKGIALLRSGRVEDACHDFKKAFSLGNKKVSEYISNNCIK